MNKFELINEVLEVKELFDYAEKVCSKVDQLMNIGELSYRIGKICDNCDNRNNCDDCSLYYMAVELTGMIKR